METIAFKPINVTALAFSGHGQLKSVPKRIEFDNRQITFIDSGMQYLVQKGQELIRLFDMTDGQTTYRLRHDQEHEWTLVRMQQVRGV